VKLDRQLRKEWVKGMTEQHHGPTPPDFYSQRAKSRRFIAAAMREAMTAKRARRKTQQQRRRTDQ